MVGYLLNLAYLALVVAVAPLLVYRSLRQGKYRQGWSQKLLGLVPRVADDRPCVWLHAVSVGEVNLLAPVLAEIGRHRPGWRCVVSTTTATGHALAREKYPELEVFYCPLDFTWAVRAAMRRVHPCCLVLAELELWPNLIAAARQHGARVAVINGRLSERSFRGYRRARWVIGRSLRRLDLIAVQNEEYAERFVALGANRSTVRVTGSIKFDGARGDRLNSATTRLAALAKIAADDIVFLAGSTQEPEEAAALAAFRDLSGEYPRLRLVIVPRHRERFENVAHLLERSGVAWQRRSELETIEARADARVLLVDTIGELGAWWGTATIAFVGGSLGNRGGQNMIEPAAYGAAVSFGPNTRNFRDIVAAMLASQAAAVVRDEDELRRFVHRCLADPVFADELGRRARELVAGQLGATRRTFELLLQLVGADASRPALAA